VLLAATARSGAHGYSIVVLSTGSRPPHCCGSGVSTFLLGTLPRVIAGHSRPSITQDVYGDRGADGRQAADALDTAMDFTRPRVCDE
jgi:hypothetical protein